MIVHETDIEIVCQLEVNNWWDKETIKLHS